MFNHPLIGNRAAKPNLADAGVRVLLHIGFAAALRRSVSALRVEDVSEHSNGVVWVSACGGRGGSASAFSTSSTCRRGWPARAWAELLRRVGTLPSTSDKPSPVENRGVGVARLRRDAMENQERVLAAAVTAVLRDGTQVPMAAIAAEAGLGVGTLYRRYPNRDALLEALTHRSFVLLLELARAAAARNDSPLAALSWWWDRVISVREQLVLPFHGGPAVALAETRAIQRELHVTVQGLLHRGQQAGSIRRDVTVRDIIVAGAMLVTPLAGDPDWDRTARRHKRIYLEGLVLRGGSD